MDCLNLVCLSSVLPALLPSARAVSLKENLLDREGDFTMFTYEDWTNMDDSKQEFNLYKLENYARQWGDDDELAELTAMRREWNWD